MELGIILPREYTCSGGQVALGVILYRGSSCLEAILSWGSSCTGGHLVLGVILYRGSTCGGHVVGSQVVRGSNCKS